MVDQIKNFIIGIFVLAAIGIITFVILFLNPKTGDEQKILRVRFADIDKVTVGTRVTFAGNPVGEVVEIRELPDAVDHRISHDGLVYAYELVLRVDSAINVFNSDEITLRTSGLLGEKSVAITPKTPAENVEIRIVNDEIIYAVEVSSVEDTLKGIKTLTAKIDDTLEGFLNIIEEVQERKIIEKLSVIAQNFKDISTELNQPEKINRMMSNFDELSVNSLALTKNANASWPKIEATINNFNATSKSANDLIDRVTLGEGSIGRLLVKDEFYVQTNALLSKAQTLMNDISHYGLLFHLDKGWQRLRARRMNLLYSLSTPQEFKNYFNDEVDQISTSLSRVYMLLDKTNDCLPCSNVLFDCEYSKVFGELLRRVNDIEESLRMYNEQRMEAKALETELCDPCCCN